MKNLVISLAVLASAAFSTSALALSPAISPTTPVPATPAYGCHLQAEVVRDDGFFAIVRVEDVVAVGQVSCLSALGHVIAQRDVVVTVRGGGFGPGFSIPGTLVGLNIFASKAGIAAPEAMFGQYSLQAGPGLSLIGVRASIRGGAEMTPGYGYAAKIEVTVEQRMGLGLDFSASTMTIMPL